MSALRVRASAANKWWRGKHRLGQLSLLVARFQGFEIAFHRFHYKPLVAGTTPPRISKWGFRKGDAMIRGKPKPGTIRMRRHRARLRWVNDPAGYYLLRHKRKHPTPRQCGGRPPTEADWARVLFTQPLMTQSGHHGSNFGH